MTKKRIRENVYLLLFQADFYQEEERVGQAELCLEALEEKDATKRAKAQIQERFCDMLGHLKEIDKKIQEKAEGWTLRRIAKSDLAILRLAVYEILYDEDVPDGVAINEAVELAKRYGGDKSYGFINGVLGSVAREIKGKTARGLKEGGESVSRQMEGSRAEAKTEAEAKVEAKGEIEGEADKTYGRWE